MAREASWGTRASSAKGAPPACGALLCCSWWSEALVAAVAELEAA